MGCYIIVFFSQMNVGVYRATLRLSHGAGTPGTYNNPLVLGHSTALCSGTAILGPALLHLDLLWGLLTLGDLRDYSQACD